MSKVLNTLAVDVRANPEQYAADLRAMKTRTTQVAAELTTATSAISQAWGKTGVAAQDAIDSAVKKLKDRTIQKEFTAVTDDITKQWSKVADQVSKTPLEPPKPKQTQRSPLDPLKPPLKPPGDEIVHSTRDATAALKTLEQILGVNLPKATGDWIEKSALVGPALSTAFKAIAVVGLIDTLLRLPGIFNQIKEAITGWDEKSRQAYQNFLSDNRKAIDAATDFKVKLAEATAASPEAGRAAGIKLQQQNVKEQIDQLLKSEATLRSQAEKLRTQPLYQRNAQGFDELSPTTINGQSASDLEAEADRLREIREKQFPSGDRLRALNNEAQVAAIQASRTTGLALISEEEKTSEAILAMDRSTNEQRALLMTGRVQREATLNRDRIGMEQDTAKALHDIAADKEDADYQDQLAAFARRSALADRLAKLDSKAGAQARSDLQRDEAQAAIQHAGNLLGIENDLDNSIAEARARLAQSTLETEQATAQARQQIILKSAQNAANEAKSRAGSAFDIQSANLSVDREIALGRINLAESTAQLLTRSERQQVEDRLKASLAALAVERSVSEDMLKARLDQIHAEEAAEISLASIDIANAESHKQRFRELLDQETVLKKEQSGNLIAIANDEQQAILQAQIATKERQDQLIGDISDKLADMFTGRIANANQSFWEAFKKLGQDAITSVASFMLKSLFKGLLSPFKKALDGMMQGIGNSLSNLLSKKSPGIPGGQPEDNLGTGAGAGGGSGAGLFGISSTGWGVILAGGMIAATGIMELLHREFRAAPQVAADPFDKQKDRSFYFNTTFPFEKAAQKITTTMEKVDRTLRRLDGTMSTVETQDPGVLMMNNFVAIKGNVQDAVVAGAREDRSYRRTLSGAVLDQAL